MTTTQHNLKLALGRSLKSLARHLAAPFAVFGMAVAVTPRSANALVPVTSTTLTPVASGFPPIGTIPQASPYSLQDLGPVDTRITFTGPTPLGCLTETGSFYGTGLARNLGGVPSGTFDGAFSGNVPQYRVALYHPTTGTYENHVAGCNSNLVAVGEMYAQPVVWDDNRAYWRGSQILPTSFPIYGEALAVNANRQVVGFELTPWISEAAAYYPMPRLWLTSTTNSNVTSILLDVQFGKGNAINAQGEAVGYIMEPSLATRTARYWNASQQHTGSNIAPAGSEANDINSSSRVAGSMTISGGYRRGFLVTLGQAPQALVPVTYLLSGQRYNHAEASSLNDSGVVVGKSWTDPAATRATIWSDGKSRDLNDGVPAGSQVLSDAHDINSAGQILGEGFSLADGKRHAYLLTPTGAAWPRQLY